MALLRTHNRVADTLDGLLDVVRHVVSRITWWLLTLRELFREPPSDDDDDEFEEFNGIAYGVAHPIK